MSNELQTTGNNELAQQSQNTAIDKRVRDLDAGYYKNVVSPEEYLKQSRTSEDSSQDLELSSDSTNNDGSQKNVAPLKHWNVNIQKQFEQCSESQQKAWLDSFKIVEKSFVKQLNALKEQISLAETIMEPLLPYVKDLEKLRQSPKEYISTLINFDNNLGKNPAYEIAKLIALHNVNYDDLYKNLNAAQDDLAANTIIEKHIAPLKEEIAKLKGEDGQSDRTLLEAQKVSDEIIGKITAFYEQRDNSGKLLYPDAFDHIEDIIELVQTGENLDTAYNLVVNGTRSHNIQEESSESEVDYEESRRKGKKLNPRELEEQMLRNTLRKLRG